MSRRRSVDDSHLGRRSTTDEDGDWLPRNPDTRSISAPRERRDAKAKQTASQAQQIRTLLQGRSQGRLVPLGPDWGVPLLPPDHETLLDPVPSHFQGPGLAIRIRCYCLGEAFDRMMLQEQIIRRSSSSSVRAYSEVLCSAYRLGFGGGEDVIRGDIFYFDFGCVVFWGLEKEAERHILREIAEPCLQGTGHVSMAEEKDQLRVLYSTNPRPVVENDTLALHYRHAGDFDVKLAVSFALAQSTRLSLAEEELRRMGKRLAYVPEALAENGTVPLSETQVMQAVGQLYKQMAAVNLLGAALDTPDAMDSARSGIRELYKAVYEYCEVAERLQLLNDRFGVLREMLELCRTLGQQLYAGKLESIVMWLVGVCVILAMFQLIGFLTWKPAWRH